jgi:hypothetical protein
MSPADILHNRNSISRTVDVAALLRFHPDVRLAIQLPRSSVQRCSSLFRYSDGLRISRCWLWMVSGIGIPGHPTYHELTDIQENTWPAIVHFICVTHTRFTCAWRRDLMRYAAITALKTGLSAGSG